METIVRRIDPRRIDPSAVEEAACVLKRGGLVAFPTETVYGLGGDALDPGAAAAIYAAKGRPSDNPLIVHIADLSALERLASSVPDAAWRLAKACWPGPLTMILPKAACVPDQTTGGLPTVAVRFPSHPVARALIEASGRYIAAPSANTSGRPSPTCARHVEEDLSGRIDMILDGGECEIGLESTIVDLTEDVPTILRPGYYAEEDIRRILGSARTDPGILREDSNVRPKAPGMRYRHYAPRAKIVIVEGKPDDVVRAILTEVRKETAAGRKTAVLCCGEHEGLYPDVRIFSAGHLAREEEIAHNLYTTLRRFDEEGIDTVYSEAFETPSLGSAIMNRLLKAAGHTVLPA